MNKKWFSILKIFIFLLIAIICVLAYSSVRNSKTIVYDYREDNIEKSLQIWKNDDFEYQILEIDAGTELPEPNPDWGIRVFFIDETSFLYFYESRSPGGIDPFHGNEQEMETIKIGGRLLKVLVEGNYVIGSCIIDSSCGIWFQVEASIWEDYQKEILMLVKSATIK